MLFLLVLAVTCNLVLRIMLQSSRSHRDQGAEEVSKLDGGKFAKLKPKELKAGIHNGLEADYKLIGTLDSQVTALSGEIDNLSQGMHELQDRIRKLNPASEKSQSAPEVSGTTSKDNRPLPSSTPVDTKPPNKGGAGK